MGLLDRYGQKNTLTSHVLNRSVDDILRSEHQSAVIERIPFKMPRERHPITTFFSERARQNAAGIRYQGSAGTYDPRTVRDKSYGSRYRNRPPNPDYLFADAISYPTGEVDVNGAGMSYAWTPLGYMLYHDRSNKQDCMYYEISNDYGTPLQLEVWTRFLVAGHYFREGINNYDLGVTVRIMCMTDPPADLLPELMFGKQIYQTDPDTCSLLIEAAADFQHRWNCGEFFDDVNRHNTRNALNKLLGV